MGKIPKEVRFALDSEGILLLEEGISVRLAAKDLRGPGRRHLNRVRWFPGCLVLTEKRAVCFAFRKKKIIDIPVEKFKKNASLNLPGENILSLSFESSDFFEGWLGGVELRFKTEKAGRFYKALKSNPAKTPHPAG
jgi:hypothetical protein